jgi:hypothetical protein
VSAFTLGHGFLALPIYGLATYVVGHALFGALGRRLGRWDRSPSLKAIWDHVPRVPAPLAGMLAIPTWAALAIVLGRMVAPKTSVLVALTRGSLTHVGVRAGATVLLTGAPWAFLSKRAPQGVWPSWSAAFALGTIAVCALALVPRHPGWLPFSRPSCVVAVALLGALSAMQVATDRLRARATDGDSRLDTSVWLGGAFTILSVLVAFDVLSLAEAAATTVGDRRPDMLPTLLAVGKALGGGVVAITVVALLFRNRFAQARYARLLVALWPSWLFLVGLGAVSVVFCGVLADLFVARQASAGSLGRQQNVLELILVTGALGSGVLTAVTCYLRVLAHRGPTDTQRTPLVAQLTASEGADRVTLRNFVIATLAAACAMCVISVGAFATNFIYTYKPALVFLEDSVLAIAAVAAFRWISKLSPTAYRRAAATFVVGLVAVYWISYQGSLAYRYPPTEIGVARALKAEAFRNARFAEESMYAAIWYYTRGISYSVPWTLTREGRLDYDSLMFFRDRDAKVADYRRLEYLACVRQHQQPEFFCERWIERLKSLGYELRMGENVLYDKDFMIFRLPRTDPPASVPSRFGAGRIGSPAEEARRS